MIYHGNIDTMQNTIAPVLLLGINDSYCNESLFYIGDLISWLHHCSVYILKHYTRMLSIVLTCITTIINKDYQIIYRANYLRNLFFSVTDVDSNAMLHQKPLILALLKIRSVCHMVNLKFPQGKHFFIVTVS